MPPSVARDQMCAYVEHHMRKIRKECGNTPSRKLINTNDQGLTWTWLNVTDLTRFCHVISVIFDIVRLLDGAHHGLWRMCLFYMREILYYSDDTLDTASHRDYLHYRIIALCVKQTTFVRLFLKIIFANPEPLTPSHTTSAMNPASPWLLVAIPTCIMSSSPIGYSSVPSFNHSYFTVPVTHLLTQNKIDIIVRCVFHHNYTNLGR